MIANIAKSVFIAILLHRIRDDLTGLDFETTFLVRAHAVDVQFDSGEARLHMGMGSRRLAEKRFFLEPRPPPQACIDNFNESYILYNVIKNINEYD